LPGCVVLLGVVWFAVPRPSCSERGPVDLGIELKLRDVRMVLDPSKGS
jgi:hypothetical protein